MSESDPFNAKRELDIGGIYFALQALDDSGISTAHLPYSMRVLLEGALRNCDGFLIREEDVKAIKLGVKNGGCAGMAYTMDYVEEISDSEEVIKMEDINIIIDNSAILFLLGTELDYEETKLNSGFVFNNPNQTDACGCGESVTLEQAEIPVELQNELNS